MFKNFILAGFFVFAFLLVGLLFLQALDTDTTPRTPGVDRAEIIKNLNEKGH